MSISRLMFMATSVRRAPSTLTDRSIIWRSLATSESERSLTRVSGLTPVSPRIRLLVGLPMPKMYVRAISTRFSRGRSTPAMRAMLALPLFVLGVALADDADDALSLDDFAVLANRLHARTNLHTSLPGRVSGVATQYKGSR